MASHVFVVDSTARRQQIKTTPSKSLRNILEEACLKFGKDPDQFILTDSGRPPKQYDLSLTVRLSGLVNGAKLQLVQASRSPSVLTIALQLPQTLGGSRVTDKFPSNTSIWLVLRKFEEAVAGDPPKKLNITQRGVPSTETGSGRLVYEQPVVNIMNRELTEFVDLQKTLMQLGFNNGSVLLRLNFRNSGIAMEEAMKQITEYFSVTDTRAIETTGPADARAGDAMEVETSAAHGAHASAVGNLTSIPNADTDNAAAPLDGKADRDLSGDTIMTPPPAPTSLTPHEETGLIASSSETAPTGTTATQAQAEPESKIKVYNPSSNPTPLAALQPYNEADYEPSTEHAISHQATLARLAQNKRLASDAEVEQEKARKTEALAAIKSATLRIRFPDQMQVDIPISHPDTSASIYTTIRDMLEYPEEKFELRYRSTKGAPLALSSTSEERLIRDLGFVGNTLVIMAWDASVQLDKRTPVLKTTVRAMATELKVPVPEAGAGKAKATGNENKPVDKKEGKKGDLEGKMKKWLGMKK